jgi:signal transduction histidine kinase
MKIKTKLRLGIGLLFAMITVLAVVGIRQVSLLSADSRNIVIANHNSLDYTRQMLAALDELEVHAGALDVFKRNLEAQQGNITEEGEKDLTMQLTRHFGRLKLNVRDKEAAALIRGNVLEIMRINLDAINRKSHIAGQTAKSSMVWIGITGTLCFIVAFTLFVNLPGYIADPIRELTRSIRQIANQNYKERVHFGSGDEFGELASSFNMMAGKLEEYDNSNLAKLMIEKRRVEELDVAKTNFIANVSHEFKTPIASIKITLDLLGDERIGNTNEEQRSLFESIRQDADRLLKITSELLTITQVESGKIHLNIAATRPEEIVRYAMAANESQAESRNINVVVEDNGVRSDVLADSEKTAWVLTNLVSNAVRYSDDHSTVRIALHEDAAAVYIAVADSGQGISAEYKDKIFDRYFRVPGSAKEGTGLGLAISREFIEAQDGTLTVQSELGTGSTFTIALKKHV